MKTLLPMLAAIAVVKSMGPPPPMSPKATAWFMSDYSGIDGYVEVMDGKIELMLNFSMVNWTRMAGGMNCSYGGFKYHIHEKWKYNDTVDRIGEDACGGGWTGSHYDPWAGCGSASGNSYCWKPTATSGCINISDYSCDMDDNPFLCEVGDWSSKYGLVSMDDDNMVAEAHEMSFYEVQASDLMDMSVVFHCNGGARAFCAPFQTNATDNEKGYPPAQDSKMDAYADFSDAFDMESSIDFKHQGEVMFYLDATEAIDDIDDYSCDEFDISIFNDWDSKQDSLWGSDCDDVIGDAYDPTRQCVPWSESSYCNNDNELCSSNSYEYDCDWDTERYSCAPGDISGKFGRFENADSDAYEMMVMQKNTLIPRTEDMIDTMSVVIHCPYDDSSTIEVLACAGIMEGSMYGFSTTSTDSVAYHSVIVAFTISVLAFFMR